MPDMGVALKQPESVFDRVGERPVQAEQLTSRPARENDARHRSAAMSALSQLPAKFLKRHGLVP